MASLMAITAPFPTRPLTSNTPPWSKPKPTDRLSRENGQMGQQSNVGAAGCALVVGLLGSLTRTSPKQRCTAQLIMTRQKQRSRTLQILKDFLGFGVLLGSFQAAWHILPVFLDIKIAADPSLPMLTETSLPVAKTAIFAGWLAGSVCLRHAMKIYSKEEIMIASASGLLLVALATVTLPHVTGGSFVAFTLVRFVYGLLMNIATVQIVLLQMRMPEKRRNQAVACKQIGYSLVSILVAYGCGGPTFGLDWRLEALLWYALAPLLGLFVCFPNWWATLRSLPSIAREKARASSQVSEAHARVEMTPVMRRHEVALATCFLACGCAFFGLSYSASQLSPNVYRSSILLNCADILGFLAAMSADVFGRKRVQGGCFLVAAICLLLCSAGMPGSTLVMSFAVIGRLCLDVSFCTILVAMADTFPESAHERVLPTFAIATRVGSLIAPFLGTLPAAISCSIFSMLCFAATGATMMLPEQKVGKNEGGKRDEQQPLSLKMARPLPTKYKRTILYLPKGSLRMWMWNLADQTAMSP